jgi:exopolyphosphatase/guanosine-5'-triphosphate,3'-diphosphate pyrophosphatase
MNEYKNLSIQMGAETIVACATSAVRDAANQDAFVRHLKSTTGVDVEVLSGAEEALWTYRGAVSGLPVTSPPSVVIDIGGGSTEVTYPRPKAHNGNSGLQRYSFQLGSVRLTERFLKHQPPIGGELRSATEFIIEELAQVRNPGFDQYQLVAVAGTATTLACLDQQLTEFDITRVSGYEIDDQHVHGWSLKLSGMTPQQIRSLSGATEGREDILAGGALILSEFMKLFRFQSVIVSERGLRYGIVLREWEKTIKN